MDDPAHVAADQPADPSEPLEDKVEDLEPSEGDSDAVKGGDIKIGNRSQFSQGGGGAR